MVVTSTSVTIDGLCVTCDCERTVNQSSHTASTLWYVELEAPTAVRGPDTTALVYAKAVITISKARSSTYYTPYALSRIATTCPRVCVYPFYPSCTREPLSVCYCRRLHVSTPR